MNHGIKVAAKELKDHKEKQLGLGLIVTHRNTDSPRAEALRDSLANLYYPESPRQHAEARR